MVKTVKARRARGRAMRPRRFVRRSRRLASQGMKLRSGRTVRPRAYGPMAVVGAAARGGAWMWNSQLGKRARDAAVGYGAARLSSAAMVYKQQEKNNGAGASAQYSKTSETWGKKKSVRALLAKLETRNSTYFVRRFGATERFTNGEGAFRCFLENIGGLGSTWSLPIHTLDLTSTEAIVTSSGVTINNLPAMRNLTLATGGGAVSSNTLPGNSNDGAAKTNNYFGPLKATGGMPFNTGIGNNARNQAGVLEWANVKFLFRCPKARPGWFKIHIVQFQDDKILPGTVADAHNAFWQKRAKALMYNPISHEVSGQSGTNLWPGCKVLKTITRRWNPDTSDNLATYNGEQIRVDLFLRFNRYVNQRQPPGQYQTTANRLDDDAYIEDGKQGATNEESNVMVWNTAYDHKARVFMVIEGTNFDAPATTFDPNIHLSYDMECRTKWVYRNPLV